MRFAETFELEQLFADRDVPRRVPLGWDWFVMRFELFFSKKPRAYKLLNQAKKVIALESEFNEIGIDELSFKINEIRGIFRLGRQSERDLIKALALIREMSFRVRGEKPYLVQIAGALGILQNCIVEMSTGEGKTLSSAIATIIIAWRGKGCHVVTSNDYLAVRDAQIMQNLYSACFLSCAAIDQNSEQQERKRAYACDITYLTSKEVTADFLRDQMALGQINTKEQVLTRRLAGSSMPDTVQRGLYSAIIDEADSVLCDGGSTPLIISVPKANAPSTEQYLTASNLAESLKLGRDFKLNINYREASLTDVGKKKILESTLLNKWAKRSRAVELVTQAIEARNFFHNSVHYVVHEEKVVIVDEATGRIMPDHEWRDGVHQAVSAKEGLEIQAPRATAAQSTFQDFFLRYKSLGGMTGTAWEARKEFLHFYRLSVVKIPTNLPCKRKLVYKAFHITKESKLNDIVNNVVKEHRSGRAVLVGTKSIEASESVSNALRELGILHDVLNALQHEREADIIALAGKKNAVTVATNMAGRGTDIKLEDSVRNNGGLHVILTEMHNSARIDRQLHGRCARQGDPGTISDIICLEDDLFKTIPNFCRYSLSILLRTFLLNKVTNSLAWLIARYCQISGDRHALKMRKNMIKSNHHFADLISYTGKKS